MEEQSLTGSLEGMKAISPAEAGVQKVLLDSGFCQNDKNGPLVTLSDSIITVRTHL